jgi:iron complex outermembrane receptor protein
MKMQQRGMLSVMGGLLCASGISNAQDTRNSILEEVVVTAEKREQTLQEVPVAASAYTSARRDLIGVNTIEDVARITPSLSYTNNDRLSIRGFGRLTNNIGTDPSVALYSDGIFSTSMADTSTPSLFIDRTEILRGPQGTLYGRNSIGGTLNVIAKRPTKGFNGEVRGTLGNYGSWRTDALLRGPITESVRFLVGGSKDRREQGFINNAGPGGDTADSDRWFVEAQLEAERRLVRPISSPIQGRTAAQSRGRLGRGDRHDRLAVGTQRQYEFVSALQPRLQIRWLAGVQWVDAQPIRRSGVCRFL